MLGAAIIAALSIFAYQVRWIDDWTRFKIYCKGRQIGITWATAFGVVQRCIMVKQKWYWLSISEDRSAEAIEYVALHCSAMGVVADVDKGWMEFEKVKYAYCRVTFPNGSQVIGLAANPRTARGAVGNLILDEFAHHINAEAIWRAASAIATWGYCVWIISTPNGRQGLFHDIWSGGGAFDTEQIEDAIRSGHDPVGDRWSRHFTSIIDAKADGHPVDLEEARALARTEDNWQQEYLGKFLDEALAWLPYSLIEACTHPEASLVYDSTQAPVGPCWLGYDVGRKRDLAVCWLNEQRGAIHVTRAVVAMERAPFKFQKKVLWDFVHKSRRTCIDETGQGVQLAEETVARFGEARIHPVTFTEKTKAQIGTIIKEHYEKQTVWIPDDGDVRRDLHSVRRTYTDRGRQTIDAPHTKDGHADRFWAQGLALFAADGQPMPLRPGDVQSTEPRRYDVRGTGRKWSGY